jgi:hypothetical protein
LVIAYYDIRSWSTSATRAREVLQTRRLHNCDAYRNISVSSETPDTLFFENILMRINSKNELNNPKRIDDILVVKDSRNCNEYSILLYPVELKICLAKTWLHLKCIYLFYTRYYITSWTHDELLVV